MTNPKMVESTRELAGAERITLSEAIRESLKTRLERMKIPPPEEKLIALDLFSKAKQTALVVIDLQKGIARTPGGAPHEKSEVIQNAVRLLETARVVGAQPILVHVGGAADGADRVRAKADQAWRSPAGLPSDWSDLIEELDRQPNDIVILKRQWGAFYGTDLDLQLRRRGLTTVILCGIATEFGVESTARDAAERGYELIFAEDAMTGLTAESHANAIERIFPRIGRVRTTDEIVAALQL